MQFNRLCMIAFGFALVSLVSAKECEDEDHDHTESTKSVDKHRRHAFNVKNFLLKQLNNAQDQVQRRKEAETGAKPDIWEIQKAGKVVDGYRILEVEWINRHQSVQLHATPGYEVMTPDKPTRRAWRAEVKADWSEFVYRERRLSKKLWSAKDTKYDF